MVPPTLNCERQLPTPVKNASTLLYRCLILFHMQLYSIIIIVIITARKRSLGQGNIFRSVCQEFCSQGGGAGEYLARYLPWTRYTPLGPGTPPRTRYTPQDQVHPQPGTPLDQVHPWTRYTPPLGPGTPPGTRTTPQSSACWEKRATSGRYASYWNAFLFKLDLYFLFLRN